MAVYYVINGFPINTLRKKTSRKSMLYIMMCYTYCCIYKRNRKTWSTHKHLLAFHHKKIVEFCMYFNFREFNIFTDCFRVLRAGRSKLHPFHMHNLLIVSRTFSWLTTT